MKQFETHFMLFMNVILPFCSDLKYSYLLGKVQFVFFTWWWLTTFTSWKKSMQPFFKFGLLLPWKGLPADLSISPWRRCTRRCICKQVGTLWRQTQYHTICTPTHTRLLPYSSLSIPHFKAERPRWRFGKKWKTNCSFVSGRRPDTWANFLCILAPKHWSYVASRSQTDTRSLQFAF